MLRKLCAAGAIVLILGWPSHPAGASMSGPCSAAFGGQDIAPLSASNPDAAVKVEESDTVQVAGTASGSGEYRVQLEFAGIRWTVAKGAITDNRWSRDVKVEDYSRYGAGLYRVHGVTDGATPCDGALLVNVGGNPLTTPFGIAGVAFVGVGVLNALASIRSAEKGTI